jgi:diguanylate cyclase (GGDEF)-like protein/PAS domain S-box-containing protein
MKPLNILVADDTVSVGQFVSTYLRDAGHLVTFVQSGEDACEVYQREAFDLVLMDVIMPGMGGLAAVKKIKALPATKWTPIILVTGIDAQEGIMDGFMAGADDYITKPINTLVLDIRIRSMMRIAAIQRTSAAVIESVIEGIVQIDRVGRISGFNKAAQNIFGYTYEEVVGKNVNMLMPSPYHEQHDDYLANYVATGEARIIGIGRKVTGKRKNGESFPMHLGVSEASTPDGRFFIGLVRDLTEEERMRSQIEYMASHDALTGLPNRAEAWKWLDKRYAIRNVQHGPADCTVFYCDLDGFKQVNDQFGHHAGDKVLKEACRRMKDTLFVRDLIARIGGDEFMVSVDGLLDDEKALAVAQRMIDVVSVPIEDGDNRYHIGVTIGIAHSRQHPESVEALVNGADSAMYVAKRGGKGRAAIA